MRMFNTLSI